MKKVLIRITDFLCAVWYILIITVVISACTSNGEVKYDDLNKNMNSTILKIEVDSTKTPMEYKFYIKTIHSRYKELNVDPDWATIFKEGDRL